MKSVLLGFAALCCGWWLAPTASAQPSADNAGYYSMRPDHRRCAPPKCGGSFVQALNKKQTRCADGKRAHECYVAQVAWEALGLSESQRNALLGSQVQVVFQGELESVKNSQGGSARFVPRRAFSAASAKLGQGRYFRLFDGGVRCVTEPCSTTVAGKLNSLRTVMPGQVDLGHCGLTETEQATAEAAIAQQELVATGKFRKNVDASSGALQTTFTVTQAYLPFLPEVDEEVLCRATGCSGQICASEPMESTCEWLPEYECVRKMDCQSQDDGTCGWTATPQSDACYEHLEGPKCLDKALKSYVETERDLCQRLRFKCDPHQAPFFDDCGCGCACPATIDCTPGGGEQCDAEALRDRCPHSKLIFWRYQPSPDPAD